MRTWAGVACASGMRAAKCRELGLRGTGVGRGLWLVPTRRVLGKGLRWGFGMPGVVASKGKERARR